MKEESFPLTKADEEKQLAEILGERFLCLPRTTVRNIASTVIETGYRKCGGISECLDKIEHALIKRKIDNQ